MNSFIGLNKTLAEQKAKEEGKSILIDFYIDKKAKESDAYLCIREKKVDDIYKLTFGSFLLKK